jgi:acyl-CoA synthetase (AMP-forming)/AMP-acid ligase II
MNWIGDIEDGDSAAIDHFIQHEHPAYAAAASMTIDDIDSRVDAIAQVHRNTAGRPRGHRMVQERHLDL